jgi:hypothetical protein
MLIGSVRRVNQILRAFRPMGCVAYFVKLQNALNQLPSVAGTPTERISAATA